MRNPPSNVGATASEVKGVWFVTARRFVLEDHGEDVLDALVARMVPRYRSAMASPLASAWYPEEAMQDAFAVASETLAKGDTAAMLAIFERCTLIGINHFWRAALRLCTPGFALRSLPVTWRHVRRGPGTMSVDVEGNCARVHYARFPYFADENYRLLVLGTLRPLLRICTGAEPRVEIEAWASDWLTASVELRV